ncbi:GRP family sugar transporter [Companilactobacillus halodurans]|uniref:Glucose transporter n=1 Tax=Companilactobacillus halodurans TaxID=2584183 RepID=A0A5P0ZXB9_9LACO|nr:GRP family sugar transporter [Companilactobacillus halodurans]MQS75139.1 glucose transporter [Companilactobacillus halodurans]MQS97746.1 glucose transporter [Companilactobacillus halodurans]
MAILIALIPSLCWGSIGLFSTKFGGNSSQQTLGLTFGGLIFGLLTYFFWVIPHGYVMNSKIIIIGLISGILWTVGQGFQFVAIKSMGVSRAVPLSMTSQIVGNALLGAAILGEWQTVQTWIVGIIGIILIVIGAFWIQTKEKSYSDSEKSSSLSGYIPLIFSTLGFMGYFIAPKLLQRWLNVSSAVINADNGVQYMIAIIFPQSIGMVIGGFLFVYLITHETKNMFDISTLKNCITGFIWAIGNVALFVSIANPNLGQAVSSTLSSLGFIVGAFGGIFLLHETKTHHQMKLITAGTVVAVLGAVVMSNLSYFAQIL